MSNKFRFLSFQKKQDVIFKGNYVTLSGINYIIFEP